MKITKPKLLNVLITGSVTINLVMLAGIGCIASIDHEIKQTNAAVDAPVVIYVPNSVAISGIATMGKSSPTK